MNDSKYRYRNRMAKPSSSSSATSSEKHTTPPLKRNTSYTGDKDASKSVNPVHSVDILNEGSDRDTEPCSVDKVNGIVNEMTPLIDSNPPIGASKSHVETSVIITHICGHGTISRISDTLYTRSVGLFVTSE